MKYTVYLICFSLILISSVESFSQKTYRGIEADLYIKNSEQVVINEKNNSLQFVVMKNTSYVEEANHLSWLKSSVLKSNSDYELNLYKKEKDNLGYTHYRYQEFYKGVMVEHGVYYVHVKDGKVISVNGEFYPNISQKLVTIIPSISKDNALAKAKSLFSSNELNNYSSKHSLLTVLHRDNTPYLCYHFELSSYIPLKHSEIYIDAKTNKVVLEINKIHTTDVPGTLVTNYSGTKSATIDQISGSQFRLQQASKNIYTKNCNNGSSTSATTDFTNSTTTWTASTAINKSVFDLYWGLEKTYDYYLSKFSRNSYDGAGTQIKGVAHYGSGFSNAFWDGTYMVFGDGDGSSYYPFSTTDIVGHELTHAVTETSAGLVYMNESGGLNESFSDIFGVAVDFYANPATANFLEGEQCSVTNTPFRNMTNPKATLQPNTYLGQYWIASGGADNGGVHTNSQVQNHWFYLLCQGGTGTNDNAISYNISGIGITDAEKIAYRNLTNYLTPNSTYADARMYAIQSAIDLFGACSNNVSQCANAWYAVGVGAGLYSNAVVSQFSSNNNYSCSVPATISFTNNSVNSSAYFWDFGDGTSSALANPSHTYTNAGNYSVKLKSTGTSSCNTTDSITKINYVTITNVGSPISACVPLQGNASASYGITKVEFASISKISINASEGYKDFTCANQANLIAGNPYLLKVTTQTNQERVAVWIDYNNDGTLNSTNELVLNSLNPTNTVTTHTLIVQTPTNAALNTPLRLRVFDDYNTISGSCATHSYGQTEDYTLRFSAVTTAPVANFYSNTRITSTNTTVNFFDSTLNAPTIYKWTFQGASPSTSSAKNPSVIYPSVGTYSVKLVATNAFGSDSTVKISYINVVSVFNMCAGTNSTSATTGSIYDSGGPSGFYQNSENCQFLINPGCTGTISIAFSQFDTESCCDRISVYNGTNTAAPLLGTYQGSTLPPTLNATSGKMLLVWYTDGSITSTGFAATWTSTLSGTIPPVANFSVSTASPPLNTSVQLTDQTTNIPYQWLWQFDDGTSSVLQNPIKTFTLSGIRTITLTATNCSTTSVITKTVMVQGPATISVTPNPINALASCGGSVAVTATISNIGSGDLQYNMSNQSSTNNINLLLLTGYTGSSETVNVNSILSSITNCTVTSHSLTNVTNFQNALVGKNVLLIPELQSISSGIISTYSNSILNFANNGGLVISCGNSSTINNEIGLFSASIISTTSSGSMNVLDTTDLITKTLPLIINAQNATFYATYTNTTGIVDLVKYSGYSVVSKKNIGTGKAIYIGYDYFNTDVNSSKILSNAIKSNISSVSWLTASPTSGSVTPAGTSTINLQFNTSNLAAGIYTTNVVINSNDLATPNFSLPVNYTVTGAASSSVSASCINFGTLMQNTTKSDSLTLFNTGCSTMSVSSLSTINAAFSYTPSTSFTIAPWSSKKVIIRFSPTLTGIYNDTLGIINNGGNVKVCINSTVTSAPIVTVTPSSLTMSTTCGGSPTAILTIGNTGGSNLTYTNTGSNASTNIKVLVITNLVYPTYYTNMLTALNSYSVNYTVTQHTLTNAAALQTALQGKDILIIPQPYNGTQYVLGSFQTYSTTINNFVTNGGTTLMSGFYNTNMMNDLGLFNSTYAGSVSAGQTLNVIDTNDVIMRGLPFGNITSTGYNYYHTFSNANVVNYAKYGIYSIASKRNIGSGRAIYLAFAYDYSNDIQFNKMLANSVKSSVTSVPWLSASSSSNTVMPGNTSTITYTFNSSGLSVGTYSSVISINSNDPITPTYTVPVTFNVSGTPTSSVSINCKNFGTITQYTNKTDSLILYNTGCATMSVTSLNTTNSVYTYTPSTSFTIAPFGNKKIFVTFSPTTIGVINDTLRIVNNGGDQNICLSGTVNSAPSISVSPNNYSVNISACNSVATGSFNIYNIGGSNLTYSISGSATTNSINVLAITNYVDMTQEYINTISSITSYYSGSNITQHSLTSTSALQTALIGKQVLLIPEMETYVSGFLQTYSTTITNFISAGGTAVICGSNYYNVHSDLGLLSTTNVLNITSGVVISDTNDVIMRGLPIGSINAPNGTYAPLLTDPAVINFAKSGSYSVVCKKQIGLGKVVFIASDFYTIDNNFSKIIANSIRYSGSVLPSWLSISTITQTVTPGNISLVTFTLNSGSLSAGNYTTNLIITSNDPLTTTYTVPVTMVVSNNPCANFALTNSNNCTGIVTFTNNTVNTVTSYNWNFGNGLTSTAANPTVTYSVAGTYSVTLTACNGTVCSSYTKTVTISGVGGPISNSCTPISYMSASNFGILNVAFNTINKSSGFANPEGYQDFSCNNQTTLTLGTTYTLNITTSSSYYENASVWIDFDNNGSFTATEQILNSLNKLTTHTLSFTPPPSAVLNTPLRMRIIDEYYSYTISSACYNSNYGQAEDYTIKIQPNNVPPVAAFSTAVNSCQGTVNFTDNSLNTPTSWIWNFGDGNASSLQNPTYTYTAAGTYTVLLIATNSFGSTFSSQVVTVNPLTFNIGVNGLMVVSQPLTYTTSLSGGLSYTWDFGDGSLAGIQNATHTYTAAGTYTVKLTILSGGCVNTMSTTVVISTNVGVNEAGAEIFGLNVFPNPFNLQASINLRLHEDLVLSIDLYNSLGQKISNVADKKLYEKGDYEFSTDHLAKGIYFLKLNQNEKVYIYKLISID